MPQMLAIAVGALRGDRGPDDRAEFRRAFFCDRADPLRGSRRPSTSTISGTSRRPKTTEHMIHALKNLSIIGALFIIAGYGRGPRSIRTGLADV